MSEDPDDLQFNEDLGEAEEVLQTPPVTKKPAAAKLAIQSKTPKGAASGEQIPLYFTSTIGPGEKKQKLLVNPRNNVGSIKQTVGSMFGLDPDEFHLSYGGVTLEDTEPLSNYHAANGDSILLIPASTAG